MLSASKIKLRRDQPTTTTGDSTAAPVKAGRTSGKSLSGSQLPLSKLPQRPSSPRHNKDAATLPASFTACETDETLKAYLQNNLKSVWPKALEENDVSTQKKILECVDLNALNKTFRYTPIDSALNSARRCGIDDKDILKKLKQSPYISKRYSQTKNLFVINNLNGQVSFRPNSGAPKEEIIKCRHLAITCAQGMLRAEKKLKFDYEKFSTAESIQKHVGFDTEKTHIDLITTAPEIHMTNNAQFGSWIANQFTQMEKSTQDSQKSKVMLIETIDHAMTLGLLIKEKERKPCYVVNFYDPNVTGKQARSEADDTEIFKTQTLGSYVLNASMLKAYLGDGKYDVVTLLGVTEAQIEASQTTVNAAPIARQLTTKSYEPGPAAVYAFLKFGLVEELRGLSETFLKLRSATQFEWLSAKHPADGRPGLYMALRYGHANAVKAFAELLKQIPDNQRAELVSAKTSDGASGLYMALRYGHADAVKAFAELLKLVPKDQRAELVRAKAGNGTPGLFIALYHGHTGAVKAFADLLHLVPKNQRAELIRAKKKGGTTGLVDAILCGRIKTVWSFYKMLKLTRKFDKDNLV